MRKVLIFLAVFGAGLAILWLVDSGGPKREGRQPDPPQIDAPVSTPPAGAGPGESGPAGIDPEPSEGDQDRVPVRFRGESRIDIYAEGEGSTHPVEHHLEGHFEATNASFSRYLATDLLIQTYDPATGNLKETVRAERGYFGVEGKRVEEIQLADDGKVRLENVTITRHEGHPLAPLTMTAPAMEGYLGRETFRSVGDERVQVNGEGLVADGLDLFFDGASGLIALERGGEATFDRGDDGFLRFRTTSEGPLEVLELAPEAGDPAGLERVQVRAREGAELSGEGRSEGRIIAQTIELFGVVRDHAVVPVRGTAQGEVVARRARDVFLADGAEVFFDEAGLLERAVLTNEPTADIALVDPQGAEERVQATGVGPLTVLFTDETKTFELVGPGRVTSLERGVTIEADGLMEALSNEAGTQATFVARDRVRVSQGDARLETEQLDAIFFAGTEQSIDVFCTGPTRMSARHATHGPTTVDIDEDATVLLRGTAWTVPLARGVRVHNIGSTPFRATAGIVRDLDVDALAFIGEEGVTWVGAFGEGEAERVVKVADGTAFLTGTPAKLDLHPDAFDLAQIDQLDPTTRFEAAKFEALEIDILPTVVEARGDVEIVVDAADRHYELSSATAKLVTMPPEPPDPAPAPAPGQESEPPTPFVLDANDVARLVIEDATGKTVARAQLVTITGTLRDGELDPAAPSEVVAVGAVHVDHEGDIEIHGDGEVFTTTGPDSGRLEPKPGELVTATGVVPESSLPFAVKGDGFYWNGARLTVRRPRIAIEAGIFGGMALPGIAGRTTIEADWFEVGPTGLVFSGKVLAQGADAEGVPITVRAGTLRLTGTFNEDLEAEEWQGAIEGFEATKGFVVIYGGLGLARGERALLSRERIVLIGSDARPAVLDAAGFNVESSRIDLDLVNFLITSERGVLRSVDATGEQTVRYAAIRPEVRDGATMLVVVSPRLTDEGTNQEARADFAAVWIHEDEWREEGQRLLWGERADPDAPAEPQPQEDAPQEPEAPPVVAPSESKSDLVVNAFRNLAEGEASRFLRALYLEGNLEVTEDRLQVARADSAYFDLEGRLGWLREVMLSMRMEEPSYSGEQQRIRVATGELRFAPDGSLRAQTSTLTTSTQDVPTYVIETGEIALEPIAGGFWRVGSRKNKLRFRNGLRMPLPSLGNLALDEEGDVVGLVGEGEKVRTLNLRLGDSARFGTSIGTDFRWDIGKVGRGLGRALGFNPKTVRGKWYTEGSYLSDRGFLLGLGLELRQKVIKNGERLREERWFNAYVHGISDRGEDRGLVRVDEDDRDNPRLWFHGRARYPFSDKQWIDVAFSSQTDAGVQSEFYEREFLRYEQRDNFFNWRLADGANYYNATVSVRVDDFRSEVEELPSAGAYFGDRTVARVGKVDILYGSNVDVAHLRRLEGDPRYDDPFTDFLGDADGLGDREVLRATTTQRLSAPYQTNLGGIKTVPWLEADLTAWDEDETGDESARRAAMLGGIDFATTLVRRASANVVHTLTPTVRYSSDLFVEESGGQPVRFDRIDDPVDGHGWSVGLRSLMMNPRKRDYIDVELRAGQRSDRGGDRPDLDRLAFLGGLQTHLGRVPLALLYDGRFDTDTDRTIYSRGTVALKPVHSLLMELSHRRGVDQNQDALFETASFDIRYTIDPKWELQLGQTVSILNGGALRNRLTVRRFGPDFLFSLGFLFRAGEGTTFTIDFAPLFMWKPDRMGILDRDPDAGR